MVGKSGAQTKDHEGFIIVGTDIKHTNSRFDNNIIKKKYASAFQNIQILFGFLSWIGDRGCVAISLQNLENSSVFALKIIRCEWWIVNTTCTHTHTITIIIMFCYQTLCILNFETMLNFCPLFGENRIESSFPLFLLMMMMMMSCDFLPEFCCFILECQSGCVCVCSDMNWIHILGYFFCGCKK